MELIDKAAVVAEIERIEYETNYEPFTDEVLGKRNVCRKIREFLDTIEVKGWIWRKSKFRVGDVIEPAKPNGFYIPVRVRYIGDGSYYCESDDRKAFSSIPICNENEYVLTEQKPADKVEPRFNIGDIIINEYGFIMQIDGIDGNMYVYHVLDDNRILKHDITKTDESCHLWTIQDAKDGDVLKEDSCTFIIERMKSDGAIVHCCLFNDDDLDLIGSTLSFDVDSTYPATKEQRDLLFRKMKEAGYEWDGEKKELKKINQKSAWTEKDDEVFHCLEYTVKHYHDDKDTINKCCSWLKSLKEKIKGE